MLNVCIYDFLFVFKCGVFLDSRWLIVFNILFKNNILFFNIFIGILFKCSKDFIYIECCFIGFCSFWKYWLFCRCFVFGILFVVFLISVFVEFIWIIFLFVNILFLFFLIIVLFLFFLMFVNLKVFVIYLVLFVFIVDFIVKFVFFFMFFV